jgi:NAD(P)-dependent dehydrogenase (short-subunit alcohol dehydrogenase family)
MVNVTVDFGGVHAFVAGGTSGINLGIAKGFATAGARVSVMSRSREKVDAAVGRLRTLGAEAAGSASGIRMRPRPRCGGHTRSSGTLTC